MGKFNLYKQQETVAEEIRKCFIKNENYVILKAKTQSGKTGAAMAFVDILKDLNNKSTENQNYFNIKNIYFITGDNQDIMEQTCQDFIGYGKEYGFLKYFKPNINVFFLKNSDLQTAIKTYNQTDNTFAYKPYNDDGTRKNKKIDIKMCSKDTLIFIDESHYGTKKEDNKICEFLKKMGISYMTFSANDNMIQNNMYVVSISATPYKEMANDEKKLKNIVELHTSEDYVGFDDFAIEVHDDKKIFINYDECDNFFNEVIYNHIKNIERKRGLLKCAIVRTNQKYIENIKDITKEKFVIMELTGEKLNGKKIDFNEASRAISLYINKKEAEARNEDISKPLLIIINGILRMGKRIGNFDKKMIAAVIDLSFGEVETTEQGLLGRMCGYYKTNTDFDKEHNNLNSWEDIVVHISQEHHQALSEYYNNEIDNPLNASPYRYKTEKKEWNEKIEKIETKNVDTHVENNEWFDITNLLTQEDKNILYKKETSKNKKFLRDMFERVLSNKITFIGNGVSELMKCSETSERKLDFGDYIYVGGRRLETLNDKFADSNTTSTGYGQQKDWHNIGKKTIYFTAFTNVEPNKILLRISIGIVKSYNVIENVKSRKNKYISTYDTNFEENIKRQVNDKKRKLLVKK